MAALIMAAAGLVLAATAGGASGITLGTNVAGTSTHFCAGGNVVAQTAGDFTYTVPSGEWTVTSWRVDPFSTLSSSALVMLRPTGGSGHTVVGASAAETGVAGFSNLLDVDPCSGRRRARALVLGWLWLGVAVRPAEQTDVQVAAAAKPAAGQALNFGAPFLGRVVNLAATLVAAPGVNTSAIYVCYSKYEQDGGEVLDPETAASMIAIGRWQPYAVAGNVGGGDNVGTYHLACNPPSTVQLTSRYVGDGGDVVDAGYVSDARTGYYQIVQ